MRRWEDAHGVGPALDFGMEQLQRVGAVELQPVRQGEGHVQQHIAVGHRAPLLVRVLHVRLPRSPQDMHDWRMAVAQKQSST